MNVVEIAPGETPPDEIRALYVWAGTGNVAWGVMAAFHAAQRSRTHFAESDWARAIEHAARDATRGDAQTIYVVRNA